MRVEQFDELGKIGQRSGQAIDLVDHDDIKLPSADIIQQSLQVGTIGRPTRISTVIISRPDQGPAGMGLTLYIGRSCNVLSIERVELLTQPVIGGDPGVDRAADGFDCGYPHDRASTAGRSALSLMPKKRGPFHFVPVIAKATLERLS